MRQRLRKVPQKVAVHRVGLFGVQPEVVGAVEQRLKQPGCFAESFGARERLSEPERAGEERAFRTSEAVVRAIAVDEGSVAELTAYRVDGAGEPFRGSGIVEEDPE